MVYFVNAPLFNQTVPANERSSEFWPFPVPNSTLLNSWAHVPDTYRGGVPWVPLSEQRVSACHVPIPSAQARTSAVKTAVWFDWTAGEGDLALINSSTHLN